MNLDHPQRARRRIAAALALTVSLIAALLVMTASPAGAQDVTIMDIQGEGHLSPLAGETVTTEGIVTAVAFNGFYLQDPDGDRNDRTSDGVFVFQRSPSVTVGDEVSVTGTVSEFIPGGASTGNLSVTQIGASSVSVLSAGNDLPRPVRIGRGGRIPPQEIVISDGELPTNLQTDPAVYNPEVDAIDFYEAMEGMYVEVDRPVAVSAVRQFSAFSSEVVTLPSRGQLIEPFNARTQRGGIFLQPDPDNTGDQNPERVQIQFDGTIFGAPVPDIDLGDRLGDVFGVVGYSFGNYEVNATETFEIRSRNLGPETTNLRPRNNQVTVATYNVLNLSATSADDAQRELLASQIVNNLAAPDVIAVQEIQDNNGETDNGETSADETLALLVAAIEAAGGPSYEAFDVAPIDGASGGAPGSNIRNAFLYNPERVELIDYISLTPNVLSTLGISNPAAFTGTRDPLVATFEFNGNPFTVVNNHLTSRFGSTPIFGGPQPFVQAGEAEREAQVGALNEFVDLLVGVDPDASVMVVGDLNTFEWTNDLAEILPGEDNVLTNLLPTDALNERDQANLYTFIFEGNSQALDHFFVTDTPLLEVARVDIVHVNVDFSRLSTDVVGSDHEPIVARFRMRPNRSADTFRLQLLHASDLEGGVDAIDRATNFAAIVEALESPATELATGIDGSVVLSAGDNYIPGPFFNAAADQATFRDSGLFNSIYNTLFGVTGYGGLREEGGRVDVSIMNIIGFDASAVGNHEFDAGPDAFEQIIEEDFRDAGLGDDRWVGAQFPYLSANLDFSADGDLGNLFTADIVENTAFATGPAESEAGAGDTPKLAPATYITTGGERIGVVGATTQLLESISSAGDVSVIGPNANDMAALAALIQPQVDALEAMGINKIVLVSHLQQIALETELAGLLDGVDVIIAGGSDTLLANPDDPLRDGDTAGDSYPVFSTDAAGDPTLIVSTDGEYSYVGRLVVDFDADGVLASSTGNGPVDELADLDLALNGPVRTTDDQVEALWGSLAAATAPGTSGNLVEQLVAAVQSVVIAKDSNVIGETTVFLDGRRGQVRTEETNYGNLTADANLAIAQAFDPSVVLSLKNGGGIRAAIGEITSDGVFLPPQANPLSGKLEGQVSQLDIENSLRFNNNLVLLTLTAPELQAVIEHAVAATAPGATPGQFGQIGGARFTYDPTQPAGSRVIDLVLIDGDGNDGDTIISGGTLVDASATYRIVTLGFLATGGDAYPFPDVAAPSTDFVALDDVLTDPGAVTFAAPGTEQDALAEFLAANHGIGAGTPFDVAETPLADDTRIVDVTAG